MQHFLKRPPGIARARIVSTEFFQQFLVAVNNPESPLHLRFRGESISTLARDLESSSVREFWFS
jgi:hypothetical protein